MASKVFNKSLKKDASEEEECRRFDLRRLVPVVDLGKTKTPNIARRKDFMTAKAFSAHLAKKQIKH